MYAIVMCKILNYPWPKLYCKPIECFDSKKGKKKKSMSAGCLKTITAKMCSAGFATWKTGSRKWFQGSTLGGEFHLLFFGKPIEINFSKMKKTSDQILQNSKYTIVFKYRPVFYQFYQTLNMYMKKLVVLWKLIQFYKQRKAVTSLYPVNHIALNVFVCK